MVLERSDFEDLQDRFDARYKQLSDCESDRKEINLSVHDLQVDIVKFGTKLNIIIGILSAIGTAFLAYLVKVLMGG